MSGFALVPLVLLLVVGCSSAPYPPPTPETALAPAEAAAIASVVPVPNACVYRGELPDPVCTPGVWNPAVTPATISSTICVSNWTDTIRPTTAYTNALKRRQMIQYGVSDQAMSAFEEDHYFPLTGGGHPRDPRNLFPQPIDVARQKDVKERQLNADICSGRKSLEQAHHDWEAGWRAYR